jgi:hypothetical protein
LTRFFIKFIAAYLLVFLSVNELKAKENFCTEEWIPYDFTMIDDLLLINRAYHSARCQKLEGKTFVCREKWPGSDDVSVYQVHAEVLETGDLAFWSTDVDPSSEPRIIPRCEELTG